MKKTSKTAKTASKRKPAKKTAKRKKKKGQVWQTHHIVYATDLPTPERTVSVTRGEHWVITQLQRFKTLTHGAYQAICHELGKKELRETE